MGVPSQVMGVTIQLLGIPSWRSRHMGMGRKLWFFHPWLHQMDQQLSAQVRSLYSLARALGKGTFELLGRGHGGHGHFWKTWGFQIIQSWWSRWSMRWSMTGGFGLSHILGHLQLWFSCGQAWLWRLGWQMENTPNSWHLFMAKWWNVKCWRFPHHFHRKPREE